MLERTLAIVKPDAVAKGLMGEVIKRYEASAFKIVALKMVALTKSQAEEFYAVHRGKGFYESLTTYMSSGPIAAMVLEGKDAIRRHRQVIGATDPALAEPGTIRRDFGTTIERNVIHGSDGPETASFEISFFFNSLDFIS